MNYCRPLTGECEAQIEANEGGQCQFSKPYNQRAYKIHCIPPYETPFFQAILIMNSTKLIMLSCICPHAWLQLCWSRIEGGKKPGR